MPGRIEQVDIGRRVDLLYRAKHWTCARLIRSQPHTGRIDAIQVLNVIQFQRLSNSRCIDINLRVLTGYVAQIGQGLINSRVFQRFVCARNCEIELVEVNLGGCVCFLTAIRKSGAQRFVEGRQF